MIFKSRKKFERNKRAAAIGLERPNAGWNFTPEDAQNLQAGILGEVVLPSNDQYHLARQAFVVNYQCFPQIIIYCETYSDVAACLAFARTHSLVPVCRAGGHNTAGFSGNNQMVIDVSRLNQVVIEPNVKLAYIGAGANFGHINAVLDTYQLHLPGGACDEVCIGGYLQCGGYGESSLMYGMNCDVLVEAMMMLFDGRIVMANKKTNADLFWAIKGGTGNNFGILLQATYQLFDLYECWGFGLRWEVKNIGAAMYTLQKNFSGKNTPSNMGYQCTMSFVDEDPCLIFRAIHKGTQASCEKLMKPLLAVPGAILDTPPYSGTYAQLDDSLNSNPPVPDVTIHTRTIANARYIEKQLTATQWQELAIILEKSTNLTNFIGLEPYGGAIRAVKPEDSAFIHRNVCFDVYMWVFWTNAEEEASSRAYLAQFMKFMDKYSNGHAYQGYPNRDTMNYREIYWGKNFNTLLAVKQKYDPANLFAFEQSISPVPKGAPSGVKRPKGKILVDVSKPITYASFS